MNNTKRINTKFGFALIATLFLIGIFTTNSAYARRWYDPETGQFISVDPMEGIDGADAYTAFGGDPVNRTDPMGLIWKVDNAGYSWHWEGPPAKPDGLPAGASYGPAEIGGVWYAYKDQATLTAVQTHQLGKMMADDNATMASAAAGLLRNEEERKGNQAALERQRAVMSGLNKGGKLADEGMGRSVKAAELGATIGTMGAYGGIGLARGVGAAVKEWVKDEVEGWIFGKVVEGGVKGVEKVVEGMGISPRISWTPNANNVVRTEAEIRIIAGKHVEIPADVEIRIDTENLLAENDKITGRTTTASYGTFRANKAGNVEWSNIAPQGKVKILFNPKYAASDEAIVAIIQHEVHEVDTLRGLFKERPQLPFDDVENMIKPTGSLHMQAWDIADQLIENLRRIGKARE